MSGFTIDEVPNACPKCAADLTQPGAVRTYETVGASCSDVYVEDGELVFGGQTDVAWDTQETDEVHCEACGERLDEPTDAARLIAAAPELVDLLRDALAMTEGERLAQPEDWDAWARSVAQVLERIDTAQH